MYENTGVEVNPSKVVLDHSCALSVSKQRTVSDKNHIKCEKLKDI